jgi:hypothetical protein
LTFTIIWAMSSNFTVCHTLEGYSSNPEMRQ